LGGGARRAEVTIGEEVRVYHENESAYVTDRRGASARQSRKIPLELIEVQVGSYLGEDDIIRLEDVYRRHVEAVPQVQQLGT
jgi:mannose-1-phosphate guanylyltransferase / mannose-6-phosphate isomerase